MTTSVVVTGLGVAAPNGLGVQDYWSATLSGKHGLGRVTRFDPSDYPSRLAGEIPGFVAENHLPSRLLPQTDLVVIGEPTELRICAASKGLAAYTLRADGVATHGSVPALLGFCPALISAMSPSPVPSALHFSQGIVPHDLSSVFGHGASSILCKIRARLF